MLIKSYGLFWRSDEVDWNPGKGNKGSFRLLGRRGTNSPGIIAADFRHQQGIYLLYGNHGPYYVGLTKMQGLGKRLRDHLSDHHSDNWDRFSWFGFRRVLAKKDDEGLCQLADLANFSLTDPKKVIGDVEALLIKAMGLSNIAQMKFESAEEWTQIKEHEVKHFLKKINI